MSVFKEAYKVLSEINYSATQIYPDACDYGTPCKANDITYNKLQKLVKDYGIPTSKRIELNIPGQFVTSIYISLIDEHGSKETEYFKVTYIKTKIPGNFDAFITIEKENAEHTLESLKIQDEAHMMIN